MGLGLEKPNSGLDRGETFFPNSGSDLDSDETFQISRNVGLDIDEIVCLLDSQLWLVATVRKMYNTVKISKPGIGRFCTLSKQVCCL